MPGQTETSTRKRRLQTFLSSTMCERVTAQPLGSRRPPPCEDSPRPRQHGFTLLETLVALAILAIALAAILRTAGAETRHTEELRLRLLADWVAQNRLALHAARGDWINIGTQNGEDTQAGIRLLWREEISTTPNPAFRRIEVGVFSPDDEQHALRKLTGFLVEQRRR